MMFCQRSAISFVLLMLIPFSSYAIGADAPVGNISEGQVKSEDCQGCHGEDGNSYDGMFPRLAGQNPEYIVKQLTDFQAERRWNDTMGPMASMVDGYEDMRDIAAYFASHTPEGVPGAHKSKLSDKGKKLFYEGNPETGVYACVNCHGMEGDGKKAWIFPRIGGQQRVYLVTQLENFKSEERKNDLAGMMRDIAIKLSDEEIQAVSEYLSGSPEE